MEQTFYPPTSRLKFLFTLFPFLIIGLAIIGAVCSYSPVPLMDEWDGNIVFNQKLLSGDYSLWWDQHNEHRILLSRILFWVDSHWFGGVKLLLIPLNYLFIALSSLVFWRGLRAITGSKKVTMAEFFLGTFVIAWLFSWSQNENLTWGFQSQFFLAQLLPLGAFYFLIKSIMEKQHRGYYMLACVFGVASAGTMANGIVALPLMLFYMIIMRRQVVPTIIIALLTIGTLSLYFHNYYAPIHHGSVFDTLKNHPLDLCTYIIFYMGNPFYYLWDAGMVAKSFAFSAGLFLLGSSSYFFIRFLLQPKKVAPEHIFLLFLLFVMITAFATGGGRLIFGKEQAFSSRYVTPALMAWASLLMLYAQPLISLLNAKNKWCILLFSILITLMTSMQLNVLKIPFTNAAFNQNVEGLALSLQINDNQAIQNIYPSPERVFAVARLALQQQASFFGIYPYKDIEQQMGNNAQIISGPLCQGSIDTIEPIESDKTFLRVKGWLFNPVNAEIPKRIQFLNDQNKIVGYAITGAVRIDVAKAINLHAIKSGFSGYISSQYSGGPIVLQGDKPSCTIKLAVPPLL